MQHLRIGIEGVGMRYSVAVAAEDTGRLLGSVRHFDSSLSLHTTPRDVLHHRLRKLLTDLMNRAELHSEDLSQAVVCIGLTGVTFRYDREHDLPEEIRLLKMDCGRVICTGDAEIIFASHTASTRGSAVVCHSGSTAYVRVDERHCRFGGWGPAFGDEGSGYWMGRSALRAIGREHDLEEPPSILWKKVEEWLDKPPAPLHAWNEARDEWRELIHGHRVSEVERRTAIFRFAHKLSNLSGSRGLPEGLELWRKIVSGLTIPVMQAWESGDPAATLIVADAVRALGDQYRGACTRARVSERQKCVNPVVLYGGVITHNRGFMNALAREIGCTEPPITAQSPGTMRPACGALLFALGQSSTGALCLPPLEVIDRVRAQQAMEVFRKDLRND